MVASAFNTDVDTKAFNRALKIIGNDALPKAVAQTLNVTADAVTKQQIRNVKRDLTVRTPFTLRSMESGRARPFKALNKAGGKVLQRMFSRAGTFSKYLWLQEEPSKQTGINGPMPIPTLRARISKSEKKSIRKVFRLSKSDNLTDGAFGAAGYFRTFVGVPRGKVKGKVRARGLYQRSANNKRMVMIRNLESDSIRIKGVHFHKKAVDKFGTKVFVSAVFKREAQKRLDKAVRRG